MEALLEIQVAEALSTIPPAEEAMEAEAGSFNSFTNCLSESPSAALLSMGDAAASPHFFAVQSEDSSSIISSVIMCPHTRIYTLQEQLFP